MPKETWTMCPILGVNDVQAEATHFEQILGFDVINVLDGVDPDEPAVYGIIKRGDAELHLQIRRRSLFEGDRESIESDVYVRVEDAASLHEELVRTGATIVRGLRDELYGMRDFAVVTPEGHRLVFGSPLT